MPAARPLQKTVLGLSAMLLLGAPAPAARAQTTVPNPCAPGGAAPLPPVPPDLAESVGVSAGPRSSAEARPWTERRLAFLSTMRDWLDGQQRQARVLYEILPAECYADGRDEVDAARKTARERGAAGAAALDKGDAERASLDLTIVDTLRRHAATLAVDKALNCWTLRPICTGPGSVRSGGCAGCSVPAPSGDRAALLAVAVALAVAAARRRR